MFVLSGEEEDLIYEHLSAGLDLEGQPRSV